MSDPYQILAQIAATCDNVSPMAPREDLRVLIRRIGDLAQKVTEDHLAQEPSDEDFDASQAAHEARKQHRANRR